MGNKCDAPTRACASILKDTRKVNKGRVVGEGGDLIVPVGGKTRVCIVAFDYKGYGCEKYKISDLTSCEDGVRFAQLSKASGAEVKEFYDRSDIPSSGGFPKKSKILEEWRRVGAITCPNDVFVFFFAGHGTLEPATDPDDDNDEPEDEAMCFVEPDGRPNFWRDNDVARMLYKDFHPDAHIIFITDCCHSGTVCDLSRKILTGRPIVHLAAVRDDQSAQDLGDGGAFTCSLIETVEHLVRHDDRHDGHFSVPEVFNACYDRYNYRFDDQDFSFETTAHFDPDTFRWPLVPPRDWSLNLPLDTVRRFGGFC
mmetsp:Transcript_112533/g.220573  ORF Transcript_112533/g.220573 Transcript_112533/m.220573 type:complete len:311 (+) Transcript_112533:77-1009(+)|eukprot:CAMPEP_0170285028 /NCGR_PEP_ID=MMETSP0116_2-20130129/42558_1 /TAXON_ID=400756 /ORGANISM="Durinskia baltica, Strain CSIRO CS-38" /LENGTH=310 /DNA_ID=CAMNT_0010536419 /DNA_START=136 /DNA_END=1068 /DNA_ORIENTATION=-